jgi:hypothetical protein
MSIGGRIRMTKVALFREDAGAQGPTYRAVAGGTQSMGRTAGEALDALATQLPEEGGGTLIIVRDLRPDRHFTAEQRRRLEQLMGRWRAARDAGEALPAAEQGELERLVDAEVQAAAERADQLRRELAP